MCRGDSTTAHGHECVRARGLLDLLTGSDPSCLHMPGAIRIHVRLPATVTAELEAIIVQALHMQPSWSVINCRPATAAVLWIRITIHEVESDGSHDL